MPSFTDMYPDETKASAAQFLHNTVAYFRSLGVQPKRILTDNGASFRSKDFANACGSSGSSTASLGLTDRRPTARPSASYSPLYANGLTVLRITTPPSAPPFSSAGSTTTTGIALTRASTD